MCLETVYSHIRLGMHTLIHHLTFIFQDNCIYLRYSHILGNYCNKNIYPYKTKIHVNSHHEKDEINKTKIKIITYKNDDSPIQNNALENDMVFYKIL